MTTDALDVTLPPEWRTDALPLYGYQVEGVEWMRRRGSGLIADEMGLGKTAQVLSMFCHMRMRMPGAHLLVVAPNNLIQNWHAEAEKWTTLECVVATGTSLKRRAAIDRRAAITVIAYDNLDRHIAQLNEAGGYEAVVYDEAHYLKNRQTKRTQAAFMLRTMRRFPMTGSPILNRVDELWSLLFLIDPVQFSNYWSFLNRYAVFGGWQNKQIVGVQNAAELRAKLDAVMLRRVKSDVLSELPPKTKVQRFCDLEAHYQAPLYRQVRDELRLEIEAVGEEEIKNPLTRILRLAQIADTPACVGGEDKSGKLDLCMEVLDEIGADHKVVLFTRFRGTARAMCDRLDKAGISYARFTGDEKVEQREVAKRCFQDVPLGKGGPRILVASYGVAREGHTLTAASHAVMVDKLYVPALQQQAEDRLHRPGQKNNVTIIELLCNKTVDTRIEKMLKSKMAVFDSIINEDAFSTALHKSLAELISD